MIEVSAKVLVSESGETVAAGSLVVGDRIYDPWLDRLSRVVHVSEVFSSMPDTVSVRHGQSNVLLRQVLPIRVTSSSYRRLNNTKGPVSLVVAPHQRIFAATPRGVEGREGSAPLAPDFIEARDLITFGMARLVSGLTNINYVAIALEAGGMLDVNGFLVEPWNEVLAAEGASPTVLSWEEAHLDLRGRLC